MMAGLELRFYNGARTGELVTRRFEDVEFKVRIHRPIRCPYCGGSGPFDALARWWPVVVDDTGGVVEVVDDGTCDFNVDFGLKGPGLYCRACREYFHEQATLYPNEVTND